MNSNAPEASVKREAAPALKGDWLVSVTRAVAMGLTPSESSTMPLTRPWPRKATLATAD